MVTTGQVCLILFPTSLNMDHLYIPLQNKAPFTSFFLNWSIVDLLVAQSCPTLCNPMDCGPSGSSVHGILQARILEGVSILFSRGSSRPRDWTQVSCFAGNFFTVWATREGVKRWGSPLELSFLFYWNIIGLQCCVNLCSIAKWFSYTYIYIYTYTFF